VVRRIAAVGQPRQRSLRQRQAAAGFGQILGQADVAQVSGFAIAGAIAMAGVLMLSRVHPQLVGDKK
jgi:hypothetical protein